MSFRTIIDENRDALLRELKKAGVRAKRENGQNFLIDGDVVEQLVGAADIKKNDVVLEIGPGLGPVTDLLLERGAKVIAVELDPALAAYLHKKYSGNPSIQVLQGDVMKLTLADIVVDGRYKLVSSLPFNITSLVLRNFLEFLPRPSSISLLIQKEVAERVTAEPGKMSMLSVSVQYYGSPRIVTSVPRSAFFPVPDVDGAIIHIKVNTMPEEKPRVQFFRTAKIGFSSRRKMLSNNLQAGLKLPRQKVEEILEKSHILPSSRPQELSVNDWERLAQNIV